MSEVPQSITLFSRAGLGHEVLVQLGVVQLAAALLMFFRSTRLAGGVTLAATFGGSALLFWLDDQIAICIASALFMFCASVVAFWRPRLR